MARLVQRAPAGKVLAAQWRNVILSGTQIEEPRAEQPTSVGSVLNPLISSAEGWTEMLHASNLKGIAPT
jgi:hypothetical protein